MRITFVLHAAGYNGGTRVIGIYAEKLQRLGHEVLIVKPAVIRPSLSRRAKNFIRRRKTPPAEVGSFLDELSVPQHTLKKFRPVEDRDLPDADVVIATWWETAEWVHALSPSKGSKVYFVQGYEATLRNQPTERVDATWRLPLHKIVVAQWLMDLAKERFGDAHASLVPNSVDLSLFHADPRPKQHRPTVGFIYSSEPMKGCDLIVAALEQVRGALPELRVVGAAASAPDDSLKVPDFFELSVSPSKDDLRALYASADVWVYAARVDGFGLPILEAMACGTPVVATHAGAAPELVDSNVGRLVASDAKSIAAGILSVLTETEAEWMKQSANAQTRARSYTWDDATVRMEHGLIRAAKLDGQSQ
jgi:glycosyltransferase involved in cell wall biosynthesis